MGTTKEQSIGSQTINRFAFVLAAAMILSSAFHFWPFEGRRAWELFGPANAAIALWCAVLLAKCVWKRSFDLVQKNLPHVSILAWLGIMVLSIGFAPDAMRAVTFSAKLAGTCIGAYTLVRFAAADDRGAARLYAISAVAAGLCAGYCLLSRWVLGRDDFGFFAGPLKYGTYLSITVSLGAVWLLGHQSRRLRIVGAILIIAALLSAGTIGCVLAIVAGLVVAVIAGGSWRMCKLVVIAVLPAGLLMTLGWRSDAPAPLRSDIAITESDSPNLRQRYIEWQALINMLEKRTIAGAGAGCVNHHRSIYYYRLPKLNTIEQFDQNGWLATAAEGGMLALACFCWAIGHYLRIAWRGARHWSRSADNPPCRFAAANLAALTAACVANLFSAVQYNGVLVMFVAALALVSATDNFRKAKGEIKC